MPPRNSPDYVRWLVLFPQCAVHQRHHWYQLSREHLAFHAGLWRSEGSRIVRHSTGSTGFAIDLRLPAGAAEFDFLHGCPIRSTSRLRHSHSSISRYCLELTLTAGVRFSHFSLDLNSLYGGGENNLNYTFGGPCPVATCVAGVSPPPEFAATVVSSSGSATTPKVGLTYQIHPKRYDLCHDLRKASGRLGLICSVPESACAGDLDQIGYLDAQGHSTQPAVYQPDYVWSYELGSKGRLFGGKVVYDASLYQINWSNIQTQGDSACAYSITLNAGHVRSQRSDVSLDFHPIERLSLHGAFGYNRALFASDSLTPSGSRAFCERHRCSGAQRLRSPTRSPEITRIRSPRASAGTRTRRGCDITQRCAAQVPPAPKRPTIGL